MWCGLFYFSPKEELVIGTKVRRAHILQFLMYTMSFWREKISISGHLIQFCMLLYIIGARISVLEKTSQTQVISSCPSCAFSWQKLFTWSPFTWSPWFLAHTGHLPSVLNTLSITPCPEVSTNILHACFLALFAISFVRKMTLLSIALYPLWSLIEFSEYGKFCIHFSLVR